MKTLTKEELLKFKEQFNEIYHSLDAVMNRVVYIKAAYGRYKYDVDYISWEYDGENFEIEATEKSGGGYCCETETHYETVTWDDLINVDSIEEKLKKEEEERKKEAEKKKKREAAQQKRRKEEAERKRYEELKAKYEKS